MTPGLLNLARKWRSKKFEHIVGQELSVKILQNSLFKGAFFPVYLFAGQRGCGKTSTARVFATALNCEQLDQFQKQPRSVRVPCLECASCNAMRSGRHSDFFEIDAASHTGVDNVRHILDASTLMPLMGRKKIYLIDEAHMLSKASFNAFLKILEEPPPSVLFILATTDPQKILETVRSRCLQLYFKPVGVDVLAAHLRVVCEQEGIRYHADGLDLIARESQGSVRDALNVLEQVRFASSVVSAESVQRVLGHCSVESLVRVLTISFFGTARELLQYMEEQHLSLSSHDHLWNTLVHLIRTIIWLKHGVARTEFEQHTVPLKKIASSCSLSELVKALMLFYHNEQIAARVGSKYILLEMVLLQIVQKRNTAGEPGSDSSVMPTPLASTITDGGGSENDYASQWQSFLSRIEGLNDPLITSVFKQGLFLGYVDTHQQVRVGFSTKLSFFREWIDDAESLWHAHVQDIFGAGVELAVEFTDSIAYEETASKPIVHEVTKARVPNTIPPSPRTLFKGGRKDSVSWEQAFALRKIDTLDVVSDKDTWKLANAILEHFPGTVYEISERS